MRFIIRGGKALSGEITLAGAKNAATKMMIASLLTEEPVTLTNFPIIGDTAITRELCERIGTHITDESGSVTLSTPTITSNRVLELTRQNRLPILALGPLLARTGEAEIPFLGGDKIGHRPVDLHLDALRLLGAEIEIRSSSFYGRAPRGLKGAKIALKFPSVGATENILLASVLAEGKTILENAAFEPEIIDLIKMLQNMGAIIELGSDRTIFIEGVKRLHGVHHTVLPDRNEAVSFACLAIATRGTIFVRGAIQEHLITFLNVVRRMGAEYEVREGGIVFWCPGELRAVSIETETHPGFMTDWQQPLAIALVGAAGDSAIHETIYENRFAYTKDLCAMGANIEVFTDCGEGTPCRFQNQHFTHRAVVHGGTPLHGANLKVRDLRSGIAHIIAALSAEGVSEIEGADEIDRGYERIDERLRALGASIKRQ